MGIVEGHRSRVRDRGPIQAPRSGWWVAALAGAAAFWLANLVISLTPVAAGYRSALSIAYVPMLVQAGAGGLLVAGVVALLLTRFPEHVPGRGPLAKALVLAVGALVVLTVCLEVPAKLRSGLAEPGHWVLVATAFNTIRILALGVTIGLVTRAHTTRQERHRAVTRGKAR